MSIRRVNLTIVKGYLSRTINISRTPNTNKTLPIILLWLAFKQNKMNPTTMIVTGITKNSNTVRNNNVGDIITLIPILCNLS